MYSDEIEIEPEVEEEAASPQKKSAAAPRTAPGRMKPAAKTAVQPSQTEDSDVEAVTPKAGPASSAKPAAKKSVRNVGGVVSRDLEALARLMASF
jgi:hypothetical protein